jgi:hypothetical protein
MWKLIILVNVSKEKKFYIFVTWNIELAIKNLFVTKASDPKFKKFNYTH